MRFSHSTLMCSLQPSFQQRSNSVSKRKHIFTNTFSLTNYKMFIALSAQIIVSIPAICANYASRLNAVLNSRHQTISRCINYTLKANTPNLVVFIFNCYKNHGFICGTSATFSWTFTPNICLISFYGSTQSFTARTNHGSTQFMKQYPCSLIPSNTQYVLKAKSTDAIFLTDNIPNCTKPQTQRET